MTDDASPENLRKFLESDDPAMVRMGIAMAKSFGDEFLPDILWLYLFHDDKAIRAVAKATFMELAPEDAKRAVKENWKAKYRTGSKTGINLGKLERNLGQTSVSLVDRIIKSLRNNDRAVRSNAAEALGEISDARAVGPLIEALKEVCKGSAGALNKLGWEPDTDELRTVYVVTLLVESGAWNWSECVKIGEPAVEPLIKALEGGNSAAARALGEIGDARAVELLVRLLEGEGIWDREVAAEALGKIGDERAVEPLIKALGDSPTSGVGKGVYRAAAEALGVIGEPAVEPLIKALGDDDGVVRAAVGRGSWSVRAASLTATVKKILSKGLLKRALVKRELSTSGTKDELIQRLETAKVDIAKGVEPLIKALNDKNPTARRAAAAALGKIGDTRAVEPLIKALGDNNPWVCESAAEALGKIGDERAIEPLIKGLERGNSGAAKALGEIGDARAVEPLIGALSDDETWVRKSAAEALGEIGGDRVVQLLIKALGDDDRLVRGGAAYALGAIGDARAVEPLIGVLSDDEWVGAGAARAAQAAVKALKKLGHEVE